MPDRAGVYLERWLRGDASRRLIIVSAERTNLDDRRALEAFYLSAFLDSDQAIADRALVCIDNENTAHGRVGTDG